LILGIGTARLSANSLHCSTSKTGDNPMLAQLNTVIDRTALIIFLIAAATPVLAFPFVAMAGIH